MILLQDLLEQRAESHGRRCAFTFVDREADERTLTFGDLYAQARRVAALLAPIITPGDRVLVLFPPGIDFVPAFYGSLLAGAVPVAAYPPDPRAGQAALASLRAIADDAGVSLLVAPRAIGALLEKLMPCRIAAVEDARALGEEDFHERSRDGRPDLAYLQYTSGSVGSAKGVRMSHGNVLAQCRQISDGFGVNGDDRAVIWLPVHHSFGLVAGVILPLYLGMTTIQMSPLVFLERPSRWLEAITRYRGTVSGAPNFALDLCARAVTADERASLDLRSWRVLGIAGEPVRPDTLRRFVDAMAPAGFHPGALRPSLGISEATLAVSANSAPSPPLVVDFDADALEHQRAVVASVTTRRRRSLVGLGRPLPGQTIEIVAEAGADIGEVWTSGANVSAGYWRRDDETGRVFGASLPGRAERYLRTGDLGFLHRGELFLVGRAKDLIIIRGHNYHPADIEQTVEQQLGAPPQTVAAFSVDASDGEELAVVVEVRGGDDPETHATTAARVRAAISEQHNLRCSSIVTVSPGQLPRTASAKLQRAEARRRFVAGELRGAHTDAQPATHETSAPPTMREVLARVLRLNASQIPDDAPLASLGADSLAMVELHEAALRNLGIDLPYEVLLDPRTRVADIVRGTFGLREEVPVALRVGIPADLRPEWVEASSGMREAPRRVLVTGATGYVGAHLALELLRQTSASVVCLVRAKTEEQGRERLAAALARRSPQAAADSERLSVALGDFTLPRLGLTDAKYDELAADVDTVVHCGAWVNFIYPYRVLERANVGGLEQVLSFAGRKRSKVVHHMSSTAVLFAAGYARGRTYPEQHPLASDGGLPNGYEQTKWVAEKNVEIARDRGFVVSNYRIGYVTGTCDDGRDFRLNEFFPAMIKGCIQVGVAPHLDTVNTMVPIDYAAAAIVRILAQPRTHGRTFHINHPSPIGADDVVHWIREYGYPLETKPFGSWQEWLLSMAPAVARRNALYPYFGFIRELREEHVRLPDIELSDTRRALGSLPCPSSYELLRTYFDMFHRVGFLAPPRSAGPAGGRVAGDARPRT